MTKRGVVKHPPAITVGSEWADRDPRMNRLVGVVNVSADTVIIRRLDSNPNKYGSVNKGRVTAVSREAFPKRFRRVR